MKPSEIPEILDLAKSLQNQGEKFIPLFTGDAGLGKSAQCQAWVKEQQKTNPNFGFIDFRLAYVEPQDFIGLPIETTDKNGLLRTKYAVPSVWPEEGEGLILFEEVNRGMLATMNGLMQITTDGEIHGYKLPKGWIMAAAINPESSGYDVNNMDPALKNRFIEYKIEYDHKSFVDFMKKHKWTEEVISFVETQWNYKSLNEVADGQTYISPRSFHKLNLAQEVFNQGKLKDDLFYQSIVSVLGREVGKAYYAHVTDNRPILFQDIKANKKAALKKLAKLSQNKMRTDHVRATVDSVIEAYKSEECSTDLFFEVMSTIESEDLVYNAVTTTYETHQFMKLSNESRLQHNGMAEWLKSSTKSKRVIEIIRSVRDRMKQEETKKEE